MLMARIDSHYEELKDKVHKHATHRREKVESVLRCEHISGDDKQLAASSEFDISFASTKTLNNFVDKINNILKKDIAIKAKGSITFTKVTPDIFIRWRTINQADDIANYELEMMPHSDEDTAACDKSKWRLIKEIKIGPEATDGLFVFDSEEEKDSFFQWNNMYTLRMRAALDPVILYLTDKFLDSLIIQNKEVGQLLKWLPNNAKVQLLYRRSRGGETAFAFHKKCDIKGVNPCNCVVRRQSCFWFATIPPQKFTIKLDHKVKVIRGTKNFGPCFGKKRKCSIRLFCLFDFCFGFFFFIGDGDIATPSNYFQQESSSTLTMYGDKLISLAENTTFRVRDIEVYLIE
ncbi:hypothetical protein RFI_35074 [Reticulomyxa filosa]|uniref:TLDc domain-containing protein n=1 Tax=Reticulomyxa filosa TaxID=46433 RepID=X6LML5_RETFI|nr:hypothetical protein RFI_35074 [Reticulomyxa filosa]|eukprot:ETO02362.1 hypothetical protein RFI_35074 [Reticulomyxa filosa]